jgi:hypothetical protein
LRKTGVDEEQNPQITQMTQIPDQEFSPLTGPSNLCNLHNLWIHFNRKNRIDWIDGQDYYHRSF